MYSSKKKKINKNSVKITYVTLPSTTSVGHGMCLCDRFTKSLRFRKWECGII